MRAAPSLRQMALFAHDRVEWEQVPAEIRVQVLEWMSVLLEQSLAVPACQPLKETPHA